VQTGGLFHAMEKKEFVSAAVLRKRLIGKICYAPKADKQEILKIIIARDNNFTFLSKKPARRSNNFCQRTMISYQYYQR